MTICVEIHLFSDLVKYPYFRDFQYTWLREGICTSITGVHFSEQVELGSKQLLGE